MGSEAPWQGCALCTGAWNSFRRERGGAWEAFREGGVLGHEDLTPGQPPARPRRDSVCLRVCVGAAGGLGPRGLAPRSCSILK